ncbi:MAG: hypothetical protein AB7U20_25210 [Planctomycetaceae bacterium]
MNSTSGKCPECGGQQFTTGNVTSAGMHGPALLPGLGGIFRSAMFHVIVCESCGLTRFYAEPAAREKLRTSPKWRALG